MHHFATALYAGVTATVLIGGAVLTSAPVEAARTSNVEKVALKEATVACKAEARAKRSGGPRAGSTSKLHHNGFQRAPHHEHQRSAQRVNVKSCGCTNVRNTDEGMTSGRATGC
jgi:hypothetical protein